MRIGAAMLTLALFVAGCGDIGNGVEPVEIEGVWVFAHDERGGDDALLEGVARIADDCLYVDDAVVVWRSDQLGEAARLINAVRSGDDATVTLPGGGFDPVMDPGTAADVVAARCPTRTVWYTRPGP